MSSLDKIKVLISKDIELFQKEYKIALNSNVRLINSITNYIVNQLTLYYESLDFQLSPNFIDIRPFLWHNYSEENSKKFTVDIRYTSYLNLLNMPFLHVLIDLNHISGPPDNLDPEINLFQFFL